MSGEYIINTEVNSSTATDKVKTKNPNKKVDINVLLNKVRAEQKKEKFENLVFFSLVAAVIVVTGIIVSL